MPRSRKRMSPAAAATPEQCLFLSLFPSSAYSSPRNITSLTTGKLEALQLLMVMAAG